MKTGWLTTITAILMLGCGNNDNGEEDKSGFFPALSFIQSQAAHIDTSVYPLLKIVTTGNVSDSVYIKREDFKKEAQDFLSLPDITAKKWKKKYTETKMYDESLNMVVLTYTPTDAEAEIRRQEVIIQPDAQRGDRVKTIYIDRLMNNGDSTVLKRLTWQVDKRFQIATIVQKKGQSDKVQTKEVAWNDFPSEQ